MSDPSRPVQRPLTKFFEKIIANQSFEMTNDFLKENQWDIFLAEERELLAQLFLLSADHSLLIHQKKNSSNASSFSQEFPLSCFQAACKVTPKSARVWFRLGSYLGFLQDISFLRDSIAALEKSIALDNRFFDAHYAMASSALRCGTITGDVAYFKLAATAFLQSFQLVEGEKSACSYLFFWHWAITLFLLAKNSGEPCDYIAAIKLYIKACELEDFHSELYGDYASCVLEVAFLLGRADVIQTQAIPLYEKALSCLEVTDESSDQVRKEGMFYYYSIGLCYYHLFEEFHRKEEYIAADKAFYRASQLYPQESPRFWQKWGQLHLYAAHMYTTNIEKMKTALLYFETAIHYEELLAKNEINISFTYALCSQALLFLSKVENNPTLIADAHEKAKKAFSFQKQDKISPHLIDGEVYAAMGFSFHALGEYFEERSYYEKAIHILQEGLITHIKNASIWYAFGLVKYALASLDTSENDLKEALIAFALASKSTYSQFPFFWIDWGKVLLSFADLMQDVLFVKEAIHRFEIALELSEAIDPDLIFHLAIAYSLLGELEENEEFFERALFLFLELSSRSLLDIKMVRQFAVTRLHFAEIQEDIDAFYSAKVLYEECLLHDPDDEDILIEYSLCLMHIGYYKVAEEKGNSSSPEEWFLAEQFLVQASKLGSPLAFYHLSCLYSLIGNRSEAIEMLYEALDCDALPPPNDILEDIWCTEELKKTPQFHDFFSLYLEMDALALESALNELMQDGKNDDEH